MARKPEGELRRGWTTGACATAAVKAALDALWGGGFPDEVTITLPKGETPVFPLALTESGSDWVRVGITKDAGDDPDVTHGALIVVKVKEEGQGITYLAGDGVGIVTKPGLPLAVGEPAINPKPREMIEAEIQAQARRFAREPNVSVEISIPGGAEIAKKTWNGRLGIKGGLSILGTTGVVRPFSCAAWIASIHRGIDVARADGLSHVAGCTGATSEATVQKLFSLPDHAMLDMGDFAGGLLKYLARHPIDRITIGGGIGKMTKLAQGAIDLHSGRSQVDFGLLADWADALDCPSVADANTALEAFEIAGPKLAQDIAQRAQKAARKIAGDKIAVDTIVIDRAGQIIGRAK
ncbi:MAG: cobalt-precorrin-5B (C(1))-methyltransferase [Pseudomonadota bacterium]